MNTKLYQIVCRYAESLEEADELLKEIKDAVEQDYIEKVKKESEDRTKTIMDFITEPTQD